MPKKDFYIFSYFIVFQKLAKIDEVKKIIHLYEILQSNGNVQYTSASSCTNAVLLGTVWDYVLLFSTECSLNYTSYKD